MERGPQERHTLLAFAHGERSQPPPALELPQDLLQLHFPRKCEGRTTSLPSPGPRSAHKLQEGREETSQVGTFSKGRS